MDDFSVSVEKLDKQNKFEENDDNSSCNELDDGNKNTISDNKIKKIKRQVKDIPDIRQEKIEYLKDQINSGNYHIDSKKIAKKIINQVNLS